MSASASKSPSKHTADIQPTKQPTASRPKAVCLESTDVRDTESVEAGHRASPIINRGGGDAQRPESANPGRSVQLRTPPTTSRLQPISQRTSDTQRGQAGRGESSSINHGSRDMQRLKTGGRVAPGPPIRPKISPTVSRPQSVGRITDDIRDAQKNESGPAESKAINRGSGDAQRRKTGSGVTPDRPIQQKITPTALRSQHVGKRTDDIRDSQRREAGCKKSPLNNRGDGDAQRNTGAGANSGRSVRRNPPSISSRLQPIGQRTDDTQRKQVGHGGSKAINRGSEDVQRSKTEGGVTPDRSIQQKPSSAASQPQSVGGKTDDVRDAQSGEAGRKEPSLAESGSGDPQKKAEGKVNPDGLIPVESPTVNEPSSITMLQGASNFQISNANFTAIGGNATIIRFGDGRFTEVQRDLIGDYIAKHIVLPAINDNSKKHILTQLVVLLPRAEAVFNDYQTKKKAGPCFEGTRVALLREMADWVTSQDESRMYILSGLAGIGKSTVAYTIASRAADLNLLGASFFFSRDETDRNNAKKLFTTIAYQLCVYDERFAKAIGDALLTERGSAAVTKDPQEQLEVLILDPLRSIVQSRARPILIIVDALDECCENDVLGVFTGLRQLVEGLPSFKIILTTRPQLFFDHLLSTNQGGHKLFRLHDIEDKIIDGDIRLYLKHNLTWEKVREQHPRRQWGASDEEIDALVHAAGRLFIIASTSVRYILDKSASNPAAQMQKLLRASIQNRAPFKDLGPFYTIILRNVVPEDCDDNDIVIRYQSVIGAIILVRYPLPVVPLAHLIDIDADDIRTVLDHLQSVILLGDDDVPRVYHKSFPDYIMDKARCKDSQLHIDPKICHKNISIRCFEIANEHLQYNILGLGTPARFMDNDDGLRNDGITNEQLLEKIPQQLRYACVYWAAHLEVANIEDSDIINRLEKFLHRHMLHWFEVLSITRKLDKAHHAIRSVLKLLKSKSSNLYWLLSDALRFISKYYEIIKRSALHIYYSALPFSPKDSLLYHRYIKEAPHGIFDVDGGPQKWGALVADLSHGDPVFLDVVKFSLNSAMLVTYRNQRSRGHETIQQGTLKIWDAFTGIPISSISGDIFSICSDFSTIASAKDNIITFYTHTGSSTGVMATTSSKIEMLALSSDGNRVAAMFYYRTICLWESRTGELTDSFDGYGYGYRDGYRPGYEEYCRYNTPLLRFSPDGTRLVYSSKNGIVKLRDGINGRFIADLHCGSWNKLQFSADSSRIASLSPDLGLKLWNSESGGLICAFGDVDNGEFVISASGSLLAIRSDCKVTLWSENCGQLTRINVLEYESIHAIAFSPDNKLAICGYYGIKIYNIETQTMSTLLTKKSLGPLAFSPDGTRFAIGTILYDAQAIYASSSASKPSSVVSIALSRDCSRLSCGFSDGIVELWEPIPTMRHIASHKDHLFYPSSIGFGPDGRLFVSWSRSGIIKLWNGGDGSLFGTLADKFSELDDVALSNSMMIVVESRKVTLWQLDTLSLVHTFGASYHGSFGCRASISDQGDLAAVELIATGSFHLFDLKNRTRIGGFSFEDGYNQTLTFLLDNSHLVAQYDSGKFLWFNLVDKRIVHKPLLKYLIQLPNIPLWHDVPVLLCPEFQELNYIGMLCFLDQRPIPVLWIPADISVRPFAQGSSMMALSCDKDIILLRLRTSHDD